MVYDKQSLVEIFKTILFTFQMAIEFKNDLNFLQHESYGFILTSSGPQKLIPWDREFGWILWYRLICGGIFMIMNTKINYLKEVDCVLFMFMFYDHNLFKNKSDSSNI